MNDLDSAMTSFAEAVTLLRMAQRSLQTIDGDSGVEMEDKVIAAANRLRTTARLESKYARDLLRLVDLYQRKKVDA